MKTPGNPSFAKVCLLALMFVSYTDSYVLAGPRGGHVVSGSASFTQDGNLTVITAGNRSIINYQSFNIAPNEIVRFVQPNANASVLNRVTSPNPTNIFGQLQGNGNVYIINPYGVYFQNGSVINVGGLYAGAGKINDADFTAGHIHFTDLAGDVRNDGVIAADNRIVLMGANVTNNGTMSSTHGLATMVSGREVYVGERNSNVFVRANGTASAAASKAPAASGSVTNTGTVSAPRVILGAGDLYSTAIVNSGVLRGHDITVNAGRNGSAAIGGKLDATATAASNTSRLSTGIGGNIKVLGGTVALQGAALDASGTNGGGSVRVGGDFHGGGTLARSNTTSVDAATTIKADATGTQGNGGSVVLWSDTATAFAGMISARGGSAGGNGGASEVSSAHNLSYGGLTDLRAPAGATGSLLLDPDNITIDTAGLTPLVPTPPTTTVAFGDAPATSSFTPALLITALGTSAVILQANNNITFNSSVNASGTTNPLTLQAGNSIILAANVAVSLGGLFTATINDHGATAANRAAGDAAFTMNTGSSITANGGVAISSDSGVAATPTGVGAISLTKLTTVGTPIQVTNTATNSVVVPANETITISGTPPTSGTLVTTPTAADTAGGDVTLTSAGAMTTVGITTTGTGVGAGGAVLLTAPTLSLTGTVAGLSLTTGTGTVATFNAGGTATTTGLQKYQGPVVLNVPTLTLTGGAAITFTDTVNGTAAATNSLVVNTPGDEVFSGVVGGTVPLVNLTTDSVAPVGGTARFNMTLPTGAVVLGGVNLSGALQVGDAVAFNTAVPTATHPTINTTGAQTYTGGATLVSNAYLLSGSTLAFNSTVGSSGAKALTLDTVGAITLGGAIGLAGGTELGSLTTVGGATVNLNGGRVNTTAAAGQTYSGSVALGAGTLLVANGGPVNFNSTVTGAQTLQVGASGVTTFANTVGTAATPLTSLVVNGAGGAAFTGGTGAFTSGATGQVYSGPVSLSVPTVLTSTGGKVQLLSTTTGAQTLEITASGLTTFGGTVGTAATPLTSLTVDGAGGTTFTGGAGATTTGAQAYTGLLTLATPVTLTITGAGFNFSAGSLDGTVGVGNGLTVTTTATGTATLGGATHTLQVVKNAGDLVFNVGTLTLNGLVGPGTGAVGAASLTANTSVQTNLNGSVAGGPAVATSGAQNYNIAVLGTATTLLSTTSDINAASISTGANDLTVTASAGNVQLGAAANTGTVLSGSGADLFNTSTLTLNGVVGTGVGTAGANTFTANTSVQTNLNGATVTTTSTQAYNKLVVANDAMLTTLSPTAGNGKITVNGALDDTTGNHFVLTLTTNAADASVSFGGLVGSGSALKDLTVNSPTTNINGGGVKTISGSTTDGLQKYSAVVVGNIDATLAGSTLTTTSVNGGGHSLVLTFTTPLTVNSSFSNFNNFTVNGGGTGATTLSTSLTTAGFQDYENPVTLTLNAILTSTNNAAITFGSSLNSSANQSLTLVTTGTQTFGGPVGNGAGGTTALGFLSTGTGTVKLNGGSVTTSAATGQAYNGAVVLGAAGGSGATTTLTANGSGNVAFATGITGSVAGQELDITSTNTVTFGGSVGTTAIPLFGLKIGGVGMTSPTIAINGSTGTGTGVTTSGATGQIYGGNVFLGTTATPKSTTLTAGAGPITFNGTLNGATGTVQALTLSTTTGLITLGGVVGGTTALNSLTTTGGPVDINGNGTAVTTSGAVGQSYGGPVLLGGTGVVSQTLLAMGNGPVTFVSTLDGGHNLEITTTATGLTTFGNTVGTLAPLTSLTVDNVASITGGGAVTTGGNQFYGGLGLGVGTTLNGGVITAGSLAGNSNSLTVNGSSSTFGQITTGGVLIYNDGNGTATFDGTIAATSLQVTGPGLTEFNNVPAGTPTTVTTGGSQSYGGPVQLDVNTTLSDTATGAITFSGTVNGSGAAGSTQTLAVVTGGTTTFNAPVGGTNALGSLTVGSALVNGGTTVFTTNTAAATNAVTTVNNGAANGGGMQTYFNDVRLNVGTTTLQSNEGTTAAGGDINFKSTVESFDATQRSLAVNTQGNEIFGGRVGSGGRPLLGLVTDGTGVDVVGGQTQFNFALPATAGAAGVRLGANGLTVNDQAVFNVTGSSSNKIDPSLVTGTDNPTVFSDGAQAYNSALPTLLQANTVLKGTTLTRTGGITGGGFDLTLDFSGGTVTVDSGITGVKNFASVGTGAASGTVIDDALFQTTGFQYYGNATTLVQNTVLSTGTTGSTIFFDGLLDGASNPGPALTVNSTGDEIFTKPVGSITPLFSLTTDGTGTPGGTAIFRMGVTPGTAGVHVGTGGITINDAVAFNATGATLTAPSVLSDGAQTYNGAATLGADTVLTNSTANAITFGSSVNGTFNLTLNSPGNEVFHGQVGNLAPLLSLTTDAVGTVGGAAIFALTVPPGTVPQSVITLNNVAPAGPATGAQTYNDAVSLSQATVLNSTSVGPATAGGAITFNSTVDSTGAPVDLTISAGVGQTMFAPGTTLNAAGLSIGGAQVTFNGSVGSVHPLNNLTISGNGNLVGVTPSIDINNGGLTITPGASTLGQTFTSNVLLSADAVLTINGAQNIAFGGTVNSTGAGPFRLTLVTGGQVTFAKLIGNTGVLRGLNSTAAGGTFFNMPITGGLAGVNVGVEGVSISGPTIFNALGSSLADLTQPTIKTSGPTTFNGRVTLNQATSIYNTLIGSSPNAAITFNGPVDGAVGLALNSPGDEIFNAGATANTNAIIGGTTPLASFTSDALIPAGGQTQFLMNVTGAPSGVAGVRVGAGGVSIADGTVFNVAGSTLVNPSLLVLNGGTQVYTRGVQLNADTVLVGDSSGTLPAGGIYSGGGAITFNSTVSSSAVTPPNLTIRTGTGQTSFLDHVTANAVDLTGAQVTFNSLVFGLDRLNIAPNGANTGSINLAGAAVTTSNGQIYRSPVTLTTDNTLTDTGSQDITFNAVVDSGTTSLAGRSGLILNTAGNTVFNGAVGAGTPLLYVSTDTQGNTFINGGSVNTAPGRILHQTVDSFQTYNDHVFLGGTAGTATLNDADASAGKITFNGAVDSASAALPKALAINAFAIQFNGALGAVNPLLSLTLTGNGTTLVNGGSISTTTFQSYGSLAGTTIYSTTALNAGTDIRFLTTLDGNSDPLADTSLTLTAPGQILFAGTVGAALPLTRLTANGGAIAINGGSVSTSRDQTYNGAVALGAATTLRSSLGGNIVFSLTLDGAFDLAVNTGGITAFNGKVGGTNALASLTTNAGGSTQFNMDAAAAGANAAGVNVTGAVTINDPVLFNVANSSTARPSVQTTTGAQTYNGAGSLTAGTVLMAGGNANIVFNSTLDGTFSLALNTGGGTIFNGLVGGIAPLLNLTTNAGGTTQINGGGVTTSATDGTQTYNDAVVLGVDALLSSRAAGSGVASGNIVFNSTVDGTFALSLNTGGLTIFNDLVGSGAALSALAVNSAANPGAGTQFNMTVGTAAAGVLVNGAVAVYDPVLFNIKGSSLNQPGVLTLADSQQTYNGAVTLATNTVLVTATGLAATPGAFIGGGEIVFGSALGIASAGGDNLSVRAGVGTTTFASTIDVATLDLGGAQATFNGPITLTGLLSVEPNGGVAGGTILLNGGSLTTAGTQTYNAAVILGADTILTSLNTAGDGGNIVFTSTVDGDGAAPWALTLNSPGDEVFNGLVGSTVPLASLTTDATGVVGGSARFNMSLDAQANSVAGVRTLGAVTINDAAVFNVAGSGLDGGVHASVASGGAQTYEGAVTLLQDTQLYNKVGGAILFNSTVDGNFGLSLTAEDGQTFNGFVGATAPLASLTTTGGTTIFAMNLTGSPTVAAGVQVAGDVTINGQTVFNVAGSTTARPTVLTTGTGVQTYVGAATLVQNTVLTGAGDLLLSSTVDGAHALTLNTGGNTFLGGTVGGIIPLTSLTTDAPGTTTIQGGAITTSGAQTYRDIVTLAADTLLTGLNTAGDGGAIRFGQTVDGPFVLNIAANGNTTFDGFVGGGSPLVSLTVSGPGITTFQGGGVTTQGFQSYNSAVSLAANAVFTSLNTVDDGGAVSFNATVDGGFALTANTSGNTVFGGIVGGSAPLTSVTTDASGTTLLNGGEVTTLGFQDYGDAVLLGAATTLTSSNTAADGGAISLRQTVDGAFALTLNTSGNTFFGGIVGGSAPLASVTTDPAGTTTLQGGAVTTTDFQNYGDVVNLTVNTTLTSLNTTGGGLISFNGTVDGAFALNVNTAGSTYFGGPVGGGTALVSLTTDAPGVTLMQGGSVTTTGFQNYGDALQLSRNTVLTSQNGVGDGGAIAFGQTVDGAFSLAINTSGNTVFGGFVGGTAPLTSVTTDDQGTTIFRGGGVTTTGTQTYRDTVQLGGDATLTSQNTAADGGAITFVQTVDGASALTVNTSGDTVFGGFVGGNGSLVSLTTDAPGRAIFQGGGVTTSGAQNYNDVAILAANTSTFTSTGAGVTFGQTLDGAAANTNALVLDASAQSVLNGNVGANVPLLNLTTTGALLVGGASVTTVNNQLYGNTLTLTPNSATTTRLTANSGNLRFQGVVTASAGLLVEGHRISVDKDISTTGNLDLETGFGQVAATSPAPLLILSGRNYNSTNGDVLFNAKDYANPQTGDANSTIVLPNAGRVLIQGKNFTMGYLQKMFSLGSVDIEVRGGVATVGDIAARDSIRIDASQVSLLNRPAVVGSGTRPNDGLNFVADNSIDFGAARIVFVGTENPKANFITINGNTAIQRVSGVSLFKDPNLDSQFRTAATEFASFDYQNVENPVQPVGGGSQALDTAAALSGALPDQKPVDVASDITITASQMEELKKLGIHPRLAQKSERRATGSKRALFAQLVDGQDPENYGLLQPIKGGISRLEPSDYVVVVDRMGEREVSSILESFEGLYGKNKEKAPEIGASFQTAFNDYTVQKQTADPAGFGPFLESQHGKYPGVEKATRSFDDLFGHIEHLGLTDKEVFKSEEHIVSDLGVSGVSSADMVKVINSLRHKLPAAQRAPSTKAPPSAPASNPAPNATAPAPQPAKKPAPLKTARQQKNDAPEKTASHAPRLPAEERLAVAGL